jgi:hypothetical protein
VIPRFSNPKKRYAGKVTGKAQGTIEAADAVAWMNKVYRAVAAY